ncbi:MAG TPA: haloacid dehalogenase-like hydrolase [Pseudonocardiaceae bacterium]|jgi:phosphoglycolate phosphatase-like HAD superfamily hydrolase
MRTLVLWDIDLTLLDLRRLGGGWYREAIRELTGTEIGTMPPFAGRTDRWIARELLLGAGVEPTDEMIDRLHETVTRIAEADRQRVAEVGVVLPGVADLLREIAGRGDVVQTLVTGNLRGIAAIKVAAFDLDDYLDLAIGGYGEVSEERSKLVAEAVAGAGRQHGTRFTGDAVVVVGDTPHDVHAALAHDARAIAVATGSFPADALVAAGAHEVLPDLGDTARALAAILP